MGWFAAATNVSQGAQTNSVDAKFAAAFGNTAASEKPGLFFL